MQAYLAILRYDVVQLAYSWLLRIWIAVLVLAALFFVAVAASQEEKASETLAVYAALILVPVSALAVAVVGRRHLHLRRGGDRLRLDPRPLRDAHPSTSPPR